MEEQRITQLEQELEALKLRVAQLERPHPVPHPKSTPEQSTVATPKKRPAFVKKDDTFSPKIKQSRTRDEWEHMIATVWLPRIAAIFAAIGAIFLFSYASISGWVNPAVRVGSGVLIGLLLIGVGEYQYEKKRRELGVGLVATGTIVSLAALFAGMALYQFYSPGLAFSLELVILFITFGLMLWMASRVLLILVSITGFLLPFLQLADEANISLFLLYEVILFAALFYAAVRLKTILGFVVGWGFLTIALVTAMSMVGFSPPSTSDEISLLAASLVSYIGTVFTGQRLRMKWNYPSYGAGLIAIASLAVIDWQWGTLIALALAGLAYSIANYSKDAWHNAVGHATVFYAITQIPYDILRLSEQFEALLFACILIGLWFVKRQHMPYQRMIALALYVYFIFDQITQSGMYAAMNDSFRLSVVALVLATSGLIYLLVQQHRAMVEDGTFQISLVVAAVGVLTTYTLLIMELPFYDGLNETNRSTTLSIAYILLALLLVTIGRIRNLSVWRLSGLLLLSVSAIKLLLFDLSFLTLVQKAFVFIGFAIVAFIISRTYFKKRKNN